MRKTRILSQALFLLLFLFLFLKTEYSFDDTVGYPADIFLKFDPFLMLTTLLNTFTLPPFFLTASITLVFTLLLGRFFCGWICPLGTIHSLVGKWKKDKKKALQTRDKWLFGRRFKYFLLVFLLGLSLLSVQLAGFLDPLSLTIRSFAVSLYPAFSFAGNQYFDLTYDRGPALIKSLNDGIYHFSRAYLLPYLQPYYTQGLLISLLFATVVGINLLRPRFWCRYLCPLGALLGLAARAGLLRLKQDRKTCIQCSACAINCSGEAEPDRADQWKITECLYCWNCIEACPRASLSFAWRLPFTGKEKQTESAVHLGRRKVLLTGVMGMIAAPFFKAGSSGKTFHPKLIRPPGALPEKAFLGRCVKCGECMKICITNGLQPARLEGGFEAIWSPVFDMKIGYCEYNCTLCGQVCPTQAIQDLPPAKKKKIKIGIAFIDQNRCLPFSFNTNCVVCEEHCPTPKKAIVFDDRTVETENGPLVLKQPRVLPELCIGCGICENKCPVVDKAAIRVTSIGESRSENNQLFLKDTVQYYDG